VARGAQDVTVDTLVTLRAEGAVLERVSVTSPAGDVPGELAEDGTSWKAGERLEPAAAYTVRAVGRDPEGAAVRSVTRFRTQDLSLADQAGPGWRRSQAPRHHPRAHQRSRDPRRRSDRSPREP
jgi:hypothetical protein